MSQIISEGPVSDPRAPVYKIRRITLRKILKANGIAHRPDEPATEMRKRIIEYGIDVVDFINNPPKIIQTVKEEVKAENPKPKEGPNYQNMGIFQLRSIAKGRGLKIPRTMKRNEIIEKLNGENLT